MLKPMYKIYISHGWQYGNEYDDLINLLKDPYFKYKNYSDIEEINDNFPRNFSKIEERKEFIAKKILLSEIVIVLVGKYYEFTEPMKMELEIAKKYKKPIIAIYSKKNNDLPKEIMEISDSIVDWQTSSIINAIVESASDI